MQSKFLSRAKQRMQKRVCNRLVKNLQIKTKGLLCRSWGGNYFKIRNIMILLMFFMFFMLSRYKIGREETEPKRKFCTSGSSCFRGQRHGDGHS